MIFHSMPVLNFEQLNLEKVAPTLAYEAVVVEQKYCVLNTTKA